MRRIGGKSMPGRRNRRFNVLQPGKGIGVLKKRSEFSWIIRKTEGI